MQPATRRARGVTVVRSAVALIVSTVASSALGMLFWLVGARIVSAEDVGRAAAAVSAITLLSGLAQMSLSTVLVRFLPTAGAATARMIGYSQAAVASVSVILATTFWLLGLGDGYLPAGQWSFLLFCATVAGLSLSALHDGAFTGLGRTRWVPARTIAAAVARVALLVAFAGTAVGAPALLGWSLPTVAVALVTCVCLLAPRVPAVDVRPPPAAPGAATGTLPTRRELVHFAGSQYLSGLVASFASYAPPVIVTAVLGPAVNGTSFYIPWLIATVAGAMSWNVAVSLVVAVATDPAGARRHLWHAVRLLFTINVVGGVVLAAGAPLILGLLGPAYAEGGATTMRIIGLALPFGALGMLYSAAAIINKRTWPAFWFGLVTTCVFLGGSYWSLETHGVAGVAWSYFIPEVVMGIALIPATMRHLRVLLAAGTKAAQEAEAAGAERVRGVAPVPRVSPTTDTGSITIVFLPAQVDHWLASAETARLPRLARSSMEH